MRKENFLYFKWDTPKANLRKPDFAHLGWESSPFTFHRLDGPPSLKCNLCQKKQLEHTGLSYQGKITGEILCPGDWVVYHTKSGLFRVFSRQTPATDFLKLRNWE